MKEMLLGFALPRSPAPFVSQFVARVPECWKLEFRKIYKGGSPVAVSKRCHLSGFVGLWRHFGVGWFMVDLLVWLVER